MITNDKELLEGTHRYYGGSLCSQHDLGPALGITLSRRQASLLAQAAGYSRHTLTDPNNPVALNDFIKKRGVATIITQNKLAYSAGTP